MAQMYTVQLFC